MDQFMPRSTSFANSTRCESWGDRAGSVHRPVRILIVDDHRDTLETLATVLRLEKYHVDTAGHGEAALHAVETLTPDIVLLDITLPDISGVIVAQRLRASGFANPIIAVTAMGFERDRRTYRAAGFDAFFGKPLEISELLGLLRRLTA